MNGRIVTFGEVMLRLKSPGHERLLQSPVLETSFGGGEANVAVSLAQFGLESAFVTALPANAAPLSEDYNVIENNVPNPVVVDLDGDGQKEILYPSYDGRVHAYWLDKTEHGSWPFEVDNHNGEIGVESPVAKGQRGTRLTTRIPGVRIADSREAPL